MKKTFAFLLPLIFFISCSNFELQMGTISVKSSDTYTIELEKTKAPIGSYVRIKAIPAPGYYIESVNASRGIKYTTPFEDNIYYIIVTDKQVTLSCYTAKLPTYSINSSTAIYSYNSKLVFDKTSTYAGDTVTVQVVPDEYYYVDESSVKIILQEMKNLPLTFLLNHHAHIHLSCQLMMCMFIQRQNLA